MQPPVGFDKSLVILVLRAVGCTHEDIAGMVRCAKKTVGDVERWFALELSWEDAVRLCDDQAVKIIAGRELVSFEEAPHGVLVKAAQLAGDDILRHFRPDYLEKVVGRELDRARLALRFDPDQLPDLGPYEDVYGGVGFYCTATVWCHGPAVARCCRGLFHLFTPRLLTFPHYLKLHWAGTDLSDEDDFAQRVDIAPGDAHRLDILFAPWHGEQPNRVMMSGRVSAISVPSRGTSTEQVAGCWVATPQALKRPNLRNQAYLCPGQYTCLVWVTCDNILDENPSLPLEITSPDLERQPVVRPLPPQRLGFPPL